MVIGPNVNKIRTSPRAMYLKPIILNRAKDIQERNNYLCLLYKEMKEVKLQKILKLNKVLLLVKDVLKKEKQLFQLYIILNQVEQHHLV
jgi:hypothetical protein